MIAAALIVDRAFADGVRPGVEMEVFALPYRQIGTALVTAVRELESVP